MIDTRVEQSGSVLRVEQSGREVCDSTGRNHVESQNESSAQPGSQNSVLPVGTHQSGVNERCESRTSFLSGSGLAMDGRVAAGSGGAESTHLTPFFLRPAYRFKPQVTIGDDIGHPGRRMRTNLANVRRHVDYVPTQLSLIESRMSERDRRDRPLLQPNILYSMTAYPPAKYKDRPIDCVLSKYLRSAINKVKCPIYDLCTREIGIQFSSEFCFIEQYFQWTPEGKRLITGSSTGEFTLWNGTAFNFETILQAHDTAIRALEWSHNRTWLLSADHDGFIKYWQDNMNNVHMFQAHKEAVRSISFAPTDTKLATGGDDGTVRIWDVERCVEERNCRGHGSDVRSVDWHPIKGLVASGSRDSQQPVKIWDPKTATCLATLRDHKNSAMFVEWNKNGNWLLTCSRDHLIKLFDIRMMKELKTFRAHKKEVTALAWHPIHEELFVSGGGDGSMAYWLVNNQKEVGFIENAHDHAIWTLKWHPMGHILASGSNDNNTKFWTRHRPGDALEDFFVSGSAGKTKMAQSVAKEVERVREEEVAGAEAVSEIREGNIPGMGLDGEVLQQMQSVRTHYGVDGRTLFPGDPIFSGLEFRRNNVGAKRTLIKQPPPKKAHRQMERLWTGSTRPVGSSWGDGELGDTEDDSEPSRMERSLLGNAPLQTPDMGPPSPKRNALDPEQAPPYPQINRMESGNQALGVEGGFAPPGPPARPFLPPRPPPGIPPPPEIMMAAAGGMIAPKSEMQCEPPGFFMNNFGPCPPPRLQWPPPMRPPCPDGRNFFDGPPPSDFSQDCPILPNQLGPMWEQSGGAGRNPMRGDQPRPLNPNDPRIQRGLKRGPAAI